MASEIDRHPLNIALTIDFFSEMMAENYILNKKAK